MNEAEVTLNEKKQTPSIDTLNIWLVEDNSEFRHTIAELINETAGMRCSGAFASCEEALAELRNKDAPEVVLMDIGLPGMSGIEGVKHLKKISPSTDVIVLTIYDDDEKVFRAICNGAGGYLLKDAPAESIVAAIHDVLQGGAPMNAHIARRVLDMFMRLSVPQAEYGLTAREKEILHELTEGLTKKQIAEKLFLSFFTIDTHLKNIYAKLHVHSRTGAVAKVLKERLL
jgi:DNA-binding NarL/FixJ family response regulator